MNIGRSPFTRAFFPLNISRHQLQPHMLTVCGALRVQYNEGGLQEENIGSLTLQIPSIHHPSIPFRSPSLEHKPRWLNNSSTRFTTPPGKFTRVVRHQHCSISLSRTSSTHLPGTLSFSNQSNSRPSYLLIYRSSHSQCKHRWNVAGGCPIQKRIFGQLELMTDESNSFSIPRPISNFLWMANKVVSPRYPN